MKRKVIVLQEELSDCGVCSLLSIFRFYGGNANLEDMRYASLTTVDGVSAYNLIECAKQYGFDAIGMKTTKIMKENLPCIAHLNLNKSLSHFVAVYEISESKIILMDPSIGKTEMPVEAFYEMFTHNIILLNPKNIVDFRAKNVFHKKIVNLLKQNKVIIFKVLILNVLFIALSVVLSFYIQILLNSSNKLYIIFIFFILAICKVICMYRLEMNLENMNYNVSKQIIPDFFHHIFSLPLKYIHMKSPGEILKRVKDLELVKEIYTKVFLSFILNFFILTSILIVICICNRMVFILFLILAILYMLLALLLNRRIKEKIDSSVYYATEYNSSLCDSLSGITSIFHNNAHSYFRNLITKHLRNYLNYDKNLSIHLLRKEVFFSLLISIFEVILNSLLIISFYYHILEIEYIVIVNLFFSMYISSLNEIYNTIPTFLYEKNIIRRVNEFYDLKEETSGSLKFTNGNINFENLTFAYSTSQLLRDKTFCIHKNEKVILKGKSGCGKSTICRLLNKEYDSYKGNIKINHVELKDINTKDLRKNMMYASQNEKLFIGTIRDNILLGNHISEKDFSIICKICHLENVINGKPFQYETFLHNAGEELSGGERQLILLARALIRDTPILILDEVLSEVNEDLEKEIINSIFSHFKYKTIIYISHKDSNKFRVRKIYV